MSDKEKINELYTLMAERFENSPQGKCQAKVYREMLDFMKDCQTADEAMKKIRASKYYLAPSVAATCDMILALSKAAEETGMDDLKAVYDAKLREIASDETAIYTAGYQEKAKFEKAAYFDTLEAFSLLFRDWMSYRMSDKKDAIVMNSAAQDFRKHASNLKKPSGDFRTLSENPRFRALIPLDDALYPTFAAETELLLRGASLSKPEESVIPREVFEEEWQKIEQALPEIEDAGRDYLNKTREAKISVQAPFDVNGRYTYSNERIR